MCVLLTSASPGGAKHRTGIQCSWNNFKKSPNNDNYPSYTSKQTEQSIPTDGMNTIYVKYITAK
jgi:hypothetical protein